MSPTGKQLDGVAVVSDIMASTKPLESARALAEAFTAFRSNVNPTFSLGPPSKDVTPFIKESAGLLGQIRKIVPVIHQV